MLTSPPRRPLLHRMGYHHAHRRLKSRVVTQSLDVEEEPVRVSLQRRVLVEQLGVNASLASPFAQLQSRQFRLLDRPLNPLFIAPLLQFLAQIVKSRNGVRVANCAPLVSAADGFAEQVVEQGSVRSEEHTSELQSHSFISSA